MKNDISFTSTPARNQLCTWVMVYLNLILKKTLPKYSPSQWKWKRRLIFPASLYTHAPGSICPRKIRNETSKITKTFNVKDSYCNDRQINDKRAAAAKIAPRSKSLCNRRRDTSYSPQIVPYSLIPALFPPAIHQSISLFLSRSLAPADITGLAYTAGWAQLRK